MGVKRPKSLEICQYINVRINYFFLITILIFSFFTNLFADFYKFFKCRLFYKTSRKSTKMFVKNERSEKLLIEQENFFSMIRVNLYFLNLQLTTLLSLLQNFCYIFCRRYFMIKKKIGSHLKMFSPNLMIFYVDFALNSNSISIRHRDVLYV